MGQFLGVVLPIILTLLLLVWWSKCCKWEYDDIKFPTKGYCVLLLLPTFCPILGWIIFTVLVAFYGAARIEGSLCLKYNKFTNKWFGVEKEE